MFESAELGQKLSKEEYDEIVPKLRAEMVQVEYELKEANFAVLVIVSGVDGAGKGETVNLMHAWFDPRFLITTAFGQSTDEERMRPDYWRFWRALPPKGRLGIFFGSWYTAPIVNRVCRRCSKQEFANALVQINQTEKMLVDDGLLIVKLWFHLSKKAQEKRLHKLEKDPETRWRVTPADWEHFKIYDRFRKISAEAVEETDTGEAPWTIVPGEDPRWRSVTVAQLLLEQIKRRLAEAAEKKRAAPKPMPRPARVPVTLFDKVDCTLKLTEDVYREELRKWQGRLNLLCREAKKKGVGSVLVFEGWDAAGKGSTVRRITGALDARDFTIIPIAAPSSEERAQHYLWRFWRHLPPKGKIAIFDRSWYGRVLVERVEGFATAAEWQRAFAEINCFEEQLDESGLVLLKYWLHIDPDEQLRRFKERENTPYKQFKITEEDYRNREKTPQYLVAANEMIERTNTSNAPWIIAEANDKLYGRIRVLKAFCERLERALS